MTTTDIAGIKSSGRVETERKDKSTDASSAVLDTSSRAIADSVELSTAVQQISALQAELASIDAVDMDKVNEIRTAISSGTYELNTQAIAESLLTLERELS
ncbi:MAG: flagellar biosynthesis anti-sigma factor FlgM [Pseudomonadota bacterium]|nr:flagellar biosynthesis anti-sigma factor FlgM [Pseudomonadota bacterium]